VASIYSPDTKDYVVRIVDPKTQRAV
jgi:hypothetical protein